MQIYVFLVTEIYIGLSIASLIFYLQFGKVFFEARI